MSFSGKPTTLVDQPIANDGFWPDLSVGEFQKAYRMPAEYLTELLVDGITQAMGEVNYDLRKRKAYWQLAGIDNVETADQLLLEDPNFMASSYKRAVYCRAKAYLLLQFATVSRRETVNRDSSGNPGKESPETHEQFLAFSQQAVRLIQGRGRITAVLL